MTHRFRRPLTLVRAQDAERGSLPMLMLVMIASVTIGAVLLSIIVSQARSSVFSQSRVTSLEAAQSGLDLALGRLRTAVTSADPTKGLVSALPCAPVSAPLGGTSGTAAYTVSIAYYEADPDTLSTSDLSTLASAGGQQMTCVAGQGTYYGGDGQAKGLVTPQYARMVSTGCSNGFISGTTTCATRGNTDTQRTVTSVYSFQVNNVNISGGPIQIYPSTAETTKWCLDAGSGTPAVNSPVSLQLCSSTSPVANQQRFSYRTDLTLQLVSSIGETSGGATYPQGLCLDITAYTTSNTISTPTSTNDPVLLKPCGTGTTPTWSQQWSFNDQSGFAASRSDTATSGTLSGSCLGAASADHTTTPAIQVITCGTSINDPQTSWLPSPALGAGNAVSDPAVTDQSVQWINFQQFGRCINDPASQPQIDFIIVPGCKQNPRRASVAKNQFLTYNSTTRQMIMTLPSPYTGASTNYCLYSQSSSGGTATQLVLLTQCSSHSGITNAALTWTHPTPSTSPTTPSNQQYRLIDANGQCMSVANVKVADDTGPYLGTDGNGKAVYSPSDYSQWSKLVTQPCVISSAQQWNAASTVQNSSVNSTIEGSTNGN